MASSLIIVVIHSIDRSYLHARIHTYQRAIPETELCLFLPHPNMTRLNMDRADRLQYCNAGPATSTPYLAPAIGMHHNIRCCVGVLTPTFETNLTLRGYAYVYIALSILCWRRRHTCTAWRVLRRKL